MRLNAVAEKKKGKKAGADGSGKKPPRPVVLLDPNVHRNLKALCAKAGVEMQEYVDNLVRPALIRDYKAAFGSDPAL